MEERRSKRKDRCKDDGEENKSSEGDVNDQSGKRIDNFQGEDEGEDPQREVVKTGRALKFRNRYRSHPFTTVFMTVCGFAVIKSAPLRF